MYQGKTRKILAVLGFLLKEYNLQFKFQTFEMWYNFYGPMDTYSFYNEFGCLTLHNAVQRGYMTKNYWTFNGWIKGLAQVIKKQIDKERNLFGIPLEKENID